MSISIKDIKKLAKLSKFEQYASLLYKNYYANWTKQIRMRLPNDLIISDLEIQSEITQQCIYLSSLFKGDGYYPAYCHKYVVLRAVDAIWRGYKITEKLVSLDEALQDLENNEDDCVERHQILKASFENGKQLIPGDESEATINKNKIAKIYEVAHILDANTDHFYQFQEIVDYMRMGMTTRQIAAELSTNAMEISRRFAKLRKVVIEVEND